MMTKLEWALLMALVVAVGTMWVAGNAPRREFSCAQPNGDATVGSFALTLPPCVAEGTCSIIGGTSSVVSTTKPREVNVGGGVGK